MSSQLNSLVFATCLESRSVVSDKCSVKSNTAGHVFAIRWLSGHCQGNKDKKRNKGNKGHKRNEEGGRREINPG